jgi:hypothetical protein
MERIEAGGHEQTAGRDCECAALLYLIVMMLVQGMGCRKVRTELIVHKLVMSGCRNSEALRWELIDHDKSPYWRQGGVLRDNVFCVFVHAIVQAELKHESLLRVGYP